MCGTPRDYFCACFLCSRQWEAKIALRTAAARFLDSTKKIIDVAQPCRIGSRAWRRSTTSSSLTSTHSKEDQSYARRISAPGSSCRSCARNTYDENGMASRRIPYRPHAILWAVPFNLPREPRDSFGSVVHVVILGPGLLLRLDHHANHVTRRGVSLSLSLSPCLSQGDSPCVVVSRQSSYRASLHA